MAKSTINNEMLAKFAAAYRSKSEMKDSDTVMEYLSGLGKKTIDIVAKTPELLLFMADNGMIKLEDIDKYLVEISWIEYPEIIEKLLRYKRNPPEVQTRAAQEQREAKASDPKNDWMTEKMPDGSLKLVSYKGTETEITIPLQIGKLRVSTIGADALSPEKFRLRSEMKLVRQMISKIDIPEGITGIEAGAFRGCTGLKKVVFPKGMKRIPEQLFKGSGIIDPVFPEDLEEIGNEAFADCQKLKKITLPSQIKVLGQNLFRGSTLVEFNWPKNEETAIIPDYLFMWSSKLEKVTLPDTTVKIGSNAFRGCGKLKELEIPDAVTTVEDGAFADCVHLKTLRIPIGVQIIKNSTFRNCGSLEKLYLPASITTIESGEQKRMSRHWMMDSRTFGDCNKLKIYAPSGSYAATFALQNHIPFEAT